MLGRGATGFRPRGSTLWFTGLSGAGKTTVSLTLEEYLVHLFLRAGLGQHPHGAQQEPGLCLGGQRGEHQESSLQERAEMSMRLHQEARLPFLEFFLKTLQLMIARRVTPMGCTRMPGQAKGSQE